MYNTAVFEEKMTDAFSFRRVSLDFLQNRSVSGFLHPPKNLGELSPVSREVNLSPMT